MSINDEMKKVLLAGIGAIATTLEKSEEMVDSLIKKGEITVEQGKVLNEELKRNVKEKEKSEEEVDEKPIDQLLSKLDSLSEEEIAVLKTKLAEMEK
ncbi:MULTISPECIES: phasin family protein [Bacillus]|uniref:phasin family protein n=1 Tax=Bacillus TaxID=1386 RepID=UPI0002F3B620|nr:MULTISPECIES: hypothetical protein [Bacillus]